MVYGYDTARLILSSLKKFVAKRLKFRTARHQFGECKGWFCILLLFLQHLVETKLESIGVLTSFSISNTDLGRIYHSLLLWLLKGQAALIILSPALYKWDFTWLIIVGLHQILSVLNFHFFEVWLAWNTCDACFSYLWLEINKFFIIVWKTLFYFSPTNQITLQLTTWQSGQIKFHSSFWYFTLFSLQRISWQYALVSYFNSFFC